MNKVSRLFLASLSTLLLAAGFARAAERVDPVSLGASQVQTGSLCPDCTDSCTGCDAPTE